MQQQQKRKMLQNSENVPKKYLRNVAETLSLERSKSCRSRKSLQRKYLLIALAKIGVDTSEKGLSKDAYIPFSKEP